MMHKFHYSDIYAALWTFAIWFSTHGVGSFCLALACSVAAVIGNRLGNRLADKYLPLKRTKNATL